MTHLLFEYYGRETDFAHRFLSGYPLVFFREYLAVIMPHIVVLANTIITINNVNRFGLEEGRETFC